MKNICTHYIKKEKQELFDSTKMLLSWHFHLCTCSQDIVVRIQGLHFVLQLHSRYR